MSISNPSNSFVFIPLDSFIVFHILGVYLLISLEISAAFGVRTTASAKSRSRAHRRPQSSRGFQDQPRKPATDALKHHKLVNTLSTRYRVNRRIVDIPNYSRDRNTESLYLDGTRTETSRLSVLVLCAKPSGFKSPSAVGPDYHFYRP